MSSTIQSGNIVVLFKNQAKCGKAVVMSTDANRIVHGILLGPHFAQVRVIEIENADIPFDIDEFYVDSILRWDRSFMKLESEDTPTSIHSVGSTINENAHSETFKENAIQRRDWIGREVKVLDDFDRVFAVATIQNINMQMLWNGEVLGNEYVVLFFTKFLEFEDVSCAEQFQALVSRYSNQICRWPVKKIVFEDGNTGKYHMDNQVQSDDSSNAMGSSSKKRVYVSQHRCRAVNSDKLKKCEKALLPDDIARVCQMGCCGLQCTKRMPYISVKRCREDYFKKSFEEKKQFTLHAMINNVKLTDGQKMIAVDGVPICLVAWRIIYCQGKSQFALTLKDAQRGIADIQHGNKGRKRMTSSVEQGLSTMRALINENSEFHPAKIRILTDNSHTVLRQMPTSMAWADIRNTCNSVNKSLGLKDVSQAKISVLRSTFFPEVDIHKKGDNFSRCTKCCEYKHRKGILKSPEEKAILDKERECHLADQRQGRALYYAWRDDAIRHPETNLCIMHDKMDHNKTSTPRYPDCPKQLDGLQKLPVTVTGILTHGREPFAISQYNVALWKGDSNATIGSLDSTLRMLEYPIPFLQRFLQQELDTHTLFSALLVGREETFKKEYYSAFRVPFSIDLGKGYDGPAISPDNFSSFSFTKPLPRIFRLQLDNCGSDNKNKYIFAYLSLLVYRGVFEEVELAFLMVGHTHEDVDAMFGHFSHALTTKSNLDLMSMMRNFYDAYTNKDNKFGSSPAIPTFVQEVPDFKTFVEPYLFSGGDAFVGIREPRRFRFYLRSDGMPCVQYMMKSEGVPWIPNEGIEMWRWKIVDNGSRVPDLPLGCPKRIPLSPIKGLEDVTRGLEMWIHFFRAVLKNTQNSATDDRAYSYEACTRYWTRILNILKSDYVQYGESESNRELSCGFWPMSRWKNGVLPSYTELACPIELDDHYFGPRHSKPLPTYQPLRDVDIGHFVLVRPDTKKYPVYLGRVLSLPKLGPRNEAGKIEHTFGVEWYCPESRRNVSELKQWENCWKKTWVPATNWKEDGVLSTVLCSFKLRRNCSKIRIPSTAAEAAMDCLRRSDIVDEILSCNE